MIFPVLPIHECTCGKRRMQDMVADHPVRLRIRFDSLYDCVSRRFKSTNIRGVVSREEIVKSEAAPIILITCFFGLVLKDLNEGLNNRARLRPVTQITENVGVDHRIEIIWLAFGDSEEPGKLPQLQKLA